MANIQLKFIDRFDEDDKISVRSDIELDYYDNIAFESIIIEGESSAEPFYIVLDKSTAIKFAKTLRTEINKIK